MCSVFRTTVWKLFKQFLGKFICCCCDFAGLVGLARLAGDSPVTGDLRDEFASHGLVEDNEADSPIIMGTENSARFEKTCCYGVSRVTESQNQGEQLSLVSLSIFAAFPIKMQQCQAQYPSLFSIFLANKGVQHSYGDAKLFWTFPLDPNYLLWHL